MSILQEQTSKHNGKMIKIIIACCAAAILTILMMTLAFSVDITVNGVVDNFNVTFVTSLENGEDNNSTAVFNDGRLTVNVVATWTEGSCGPNYKTPTGTLTFTNTDSVDRVLSFDYQVEGKGTCVAGSGTLSGPGSFSAVVEAGNSLVIVMNSYKSKSGNETAILYNISSAPADTQYALTFNASTGGTISVNNAAVNDTLNVNVSNVTGVNVTATASTGKRFIAWVDADNKIMSMRSSDTVHPTDNAVIHAIFSDTEVPFFRVDNILYDNYSTAITAAENGLLKRLILVKDATLPAGEYSVPNGVTLLIPYNDNYTVFTDSPKVNYGSYTVPSPYVTLTLAEGASLSVNGGGILSVPSEISATGTGSGSHNGTPSGKHGKIILSEGSEITLENGSKLYCYGYITGSGSVNALSGSEVWEAFQIRSWRGGNASVAMVDHNFFPLSQYYVQNVEAPLILNAGATENVFTAVNAVNKEHISNATFIGNKGLFSLSDGYVVKWYDGTTDRIVFEVNGNLSLTSLTLRDLPAIGSISTSLVDTLPITNNVTIRVNSGNTLIGEDLSFLPGCEIYVAENASIEIKQGKNVILYDGDNWGEYAATDKYLVPIGYTAVNGTSNIRTAADLVDVILDINGTLTINGHLLTTGAEDELNIGADITSSNMTGQIIFASTTPVDITETYQVTQSGNEISDIIPIPVTSAKLHNADGTYTLTTEASDGDTYVYCPVCDEWGLDEDHVHSFTVTWMDSDGETELGSDSVLYGQMPVYASELPQKDGDGTFGYRFASWYKKLSVVTEDVTYTAEYYAIDAQHEDAIIDEDLKFAAKSVTLHHNLTLSFKISQDLLVDCSDVYVISTLNGMGVKIVNNNGEVDNKNRLVFNFNNLAPQYINTTVYSVIYVVKNGTVYRSPLIEYSISNYCRNILGNETYSGSEYANMRKALVDLLIYGDHAQTYVGHRVNDLASSVLTADQLAIASTGVPEMHSVREEINVLENPGAAWKGRGLYLINGVEIRLTFETEMNPNKLKVVFKDGNGNILKTVKGSAFEYSTTPNRYIVYFDGYHFGQMSEPVYATVLDASGNAISSTQVYSVESYCYQITNGNYAPELKEFVAAMMNLGNSAKAV